MSGPTPFTQEKIRQQLEEVESAINVGWDYRVEFTSDFRDPFFLGWKRHYLLKRLLALQLKEFDK